MTPMLLLVLLGSLALAGVAVYAFRLRSRAPAHDPDRDQLSLTFETSTAKAKRGWAAFWARDPFVQAQRAREGTAFGTYRVPGSDEMAVHLSTADLERHTLILGATGSGKSSLLETLALTHLRAGHGFTLVDLHGDLFTRVAAWALTTKPQHLVLLDFTRPELLPGWNALAPIPGVDPGRHVDLLLGILKRLYADEDAASWAWGVKVHELARHALDAMVTSASPMSLVDLPSFFLLPSVRQGVLQSLPEAHSARVYFTTRFGAREEMYVSAVLNKLEPFLGSIAVQRFLGQPTSTFDLMGAIDRGDTILVNLSRGYCGPVADVMGRFIVNVLKTAALRRERIAPARRTPYALLLDEAHVLAGEDSGLEEFLVAARKYRVSVTLAAQGLSLFPPNFRAHLLGNTARQFFFRLPHSEARSLAPDIFEALGSVWRAQTRPNERIDDPLLTSAEEIAWRTRELSSLPVGACYWYLKDRPYKARRVQLLRPVDPPLHGRALDQAIDAAMTAQKSGAAPPALEEMLDSAFHRAIAVRSARRERRVRDEARITAIADAS